MENYEEYTDEMLIQMMEVSYDLDESMFYVLSELGLRRHPRTEEFCLQAIVDHLGYQEYYVSSAIETLYSINEEKTIEQINLHLSAFHIRTIQSILALLWVDSSIYTEMPEKVALIDTMKTYLQGLNEEQINVLGNDYDEFVKAYGLD